MALQLVVTTTFPNYPRGTIIRDAGVINQIRSSEYASLVVLVSDTVIPPPEPPIPGGGLNDASYQELLNLYRQVATQNTQQQQAIAALLDTNTDQTSAITGLSDTVQSIDSRTASLPNQITSLSSAVSNAATLTQTTAQTVSTLDARTQVVPQNSNDIADLKLAVAALTTRINAIGTGASTPANLADDVPLAENDGVKIATNAGVILVGDAPRN